MEPVVSERAYNSDADDHNHGKDNLHRNGNAPLSRRALNPVEAEVDPVRHHDTYGSLVNHCAKHQSRQKLTECDQGTFQHDVAATLMRR